jgi:hypothetical protein
MQVYTYMDYRLDAQRNLAPVCIEAVLPYSVTCFKLTSTLTHKYILTPQCVVTKRR